MRQNTKLLMLLAIMLAAFFVLPAGQSLIVSAVCDSLIVAIVLRRWSASKVSTLETASVQTSSRSAHVTSS